MDDELYIMWLARIEGVSLKKQHYLLNLFKKPEEIFSASSQLLKHINGISECEINSIIKMQNDNIIANYEKELVNKEVEFISILNKKYPPLLKEIENPPLGLYVKGTFPKNNSIMVSIVGSRRCSEYGCMVSHKISKELAINGITVVSGMACGIDSMAHKGAIEASGGTTIAVLGCGVDICYPIENRKLKEQIEKNGCTISEFPPGSKPLPFCFPMRNRIISGLSSITIVIEATRKSGSLITASLALEQGRDVMAVPGNITNKLSFGTNELIRDGAAIVLNCEDIFYALGMSSSEVSEIAAKNNLKKSKNNIIDSLAPDEKLVYSCISSEPISADEIINKINCQAQTVAYVLTLLEIRGHIKKLAGTKYVLAL